MFVGPGGSTATKTPVQFGFSFITPLNGSVQGDLQFFFGAKLEVAYIYKTFKWGHTPKFFDCTNYEPDANNAVTSRNSASVSIIATFTSAKSGSAPTSNAGATKNL
jgi:hypothetical protein